MTTRLTAAPARAHRGFTLIELLIVISIIALLIALLMPTLARARMMAKRVNCLSNMRNLALAHMLYLNENNNRLIQAGLSHAEEHEEHEEEEHEEEEHDHAHLDERKSWVETLQGYYQTELLLRAPNDESPHWGPGGTPLFVEDEPHFRRTSYGINHYLDSNLTPLPIKYDKITQIKNTSSVIHFCIIAETGPIAVADHVDVHHMFEHGPDEIPIHAAEHIATSMYGGERMTWEGLSNYAFLDGHVESLTLEEVVRSERDNKFNPQFAR